MRTQKCYKEVKVRRAQTERQADPPHGPPDPHGVHFACVDKQAGWLPHTDPVVWWVNWVLSQLAS